MRKGLPSLGEADPKFTNVRLYRYTRDCLLQATIVRVTGDIMKRLINCSISFFLMCGLAFCANDTFQGNVVKKPYDPSGNSKQPQSTNTQILYHGGPVMNLSNSVYVI